MKRVSRDECEDGPLFEEQETEGQRQLHSLLLQQLHTSVDIQRCVSKRQCFAPAALYCPFGDQAAGVRSLAQFRALQDGEKELSALRDLGLTEDEIQLWRSRDHQQADRSRGVSADPSAREQRLQQIRDKMEAHAQLLSRPQRFNRSRALTRREMEIEQALYQGSERPSFLSALYHRDAAETVQQAPTSSHTIDSVYREVLEEDPSSASKRNKKRKRLKAQTDANPSQTEERLQAEKTDQSEEPKSRREEQTGQSEEPESRREEQTGQSEEPESRCEEQTGQSEEPESRREEQTGQSDEPESRREEQTGQSEEPESRREEQTGQSEEPESRREEQTGQWDEPGRDKRLRLAPATRIDLKQPISSLRAGSHVPVALRGDVEAVSEEDILANRETDEAIRSIPRFRNYQPGKPSKVLCVKNLAAHATVAQLVALFSRFEPSGGVIVYKLLTGRLKGQAFITLPDVETAEKALQLLHGYRLLEKPLVVEFGREKNDSTRQQSQEKT